MSNPFYKPAQFFFMISTRNSAIYKTEKRININNLNGGFVYSLYVNLESLAILHCIK